MHKINILTLFPQMFESILTNSIIARAQKKRLIKVKVYNLRNWAKDKRKTVDDRVYGGGVGMLLRVDIIDRAIATLKRKTKNEKRKIILLTPQGKTFNQKIAKNLSSYSNLLLICGHYEGFDERIRKLVDVEISIGNYVLTGGEIPAMVITDTVSRLVPGVLGKDASSEIESFSMDKFVKNSSDIKNFKLKIKNCKEFPQYTRPDSYCSISKTYKKLLTVPKILKSGNHQAIYQWRLQQIAKQGKPKRITGLTK